MKTGCMQNHQRFTAVGFCPPFLGFILVFAMSVTAWSQEGTTTGESAGSEFIQQGLGPNGGTETESKPDDEKSNTPTTLKWLHCVMCFVFVLIALVCLSPFAKTVLLHPIVAFLSIGEAYLGCSLVFGVLYFLPMDLGFNIPISDHAKWACMVLSTYLFSAYAGYRLHERAAPSHHSDFAASLSRWSFDLFRRSLSR